MEENLDYFIKTIDNITLKADYVDIKASKGNNTNIIMKDNKIQEVNTGIDIGARIRVLKNGAWGFAFTNDLNKLDEIAKTAIKLSNVLNGDVELAEAEIVEDNVKTPRKIPFSDVTIEDKKRNNN